MTTVRKMRKKKNIATRRLRLGEYVVVARNVYVVAILDNAKNERGLVTLVSLATGDRWCDPVWVDNPWGRGVLPEKLDLERKEITGWVVVGREEATRIMQQKVY